MSKEIADVLRAAREKIAVPERWTKGVLARHANGSSIGPREANAVCWCGEGAIKSVATDVNWRVVILAHAALSRATHSYNISDFNDAPTTTHADILAAFDRAIAEQERAP